MTKIAKLTPKDAVGGFDYSSIDKDLAKALKVAAKKINDEVRTQTESIVITGNLLLSVKAQVKHGFFSRWIREELRCTVRTAENYMLAADLASESKSEIISRLPPTSVYKLASPSMPTEAKSRILNALAANDVEVGIIEAEIHSVHQEVKRAKKAPLLVLENDELNQASVINEIASLLQAALSADVYRRVCTLITCPVILENPATLPPILLKRFDAKYA